MRIGFVPGSLDMLSGEHFPHFIHMQENVRALRRKCEIAVLTADRANTRYARFQKSVLYEILNSRHLHPVRKLSNLLFFLIVYRELRSKIDSNQNDLFLVRYSLSNYFILKHLHQAGCKILLEVHGLAHVEEREYGQGNMPSFYYSIVAWLEKRMLGWADVMTTGSEACKKSLTEMGINGVQVHVIPNAVATDKFSGVLKPQEIVKQLNLEGKTVVGFVGSFARYHGLDILIDIAENLERTFNTVIFLLIGKNVHGSDSPMKRISARKMDHMFTFTGEVPHSEVPSLVAAMDIAIIPDSNTYGSPMKLFEYMAMKKAIIAPDVPPIREIIEDGETGILFERGDSCGAARAIKRLIEDDELRHQLGRKAHEAVVNHYTWDQRADRIAEIAERMMG